MFDEAETYWDLDRLTIDLASAKAVCLRKSLASLSGTEYKYLKGIICNKSPSDIAKLYQVGRSTVRSCLSQFIYRYIEILAEQQAQETVRISHWHDVPLILEQLGYKRTLLSEVQQVEESASLRSCWEGAPEVSEIFGREVLLHKIINSIAEKKRRIVLLTGANGIGKTTLAVKVAKILEEKLQYNVFWQSLIDTLPLDQVLDKIQHLWGSQDLSLSSTEDKLEQFMFHLQHRPCLVVLDGMETLLENRTYKQSHRNYMDLFRHVCESAHASCVLLTSTEPVRNIEVLRSKGFAVEHIDVRGLDKSATRQLLQVSGVDCNDWKGCDRIHRIYDGNPLFIKITATTIQDLCGGKVSVFTELDTIFIHEQVQVILSHTWQGLSENEQLVLTCLYHIHHPISLGDLKEKLKNEIQGSSLINALKYLKHLSLVSVFNDVPITYQLVPAIRRYLSDQIVL